MPARSPDQLVKDLTSRISSTEAAFHRDYWESQLETSPETERRRADSELAVRRVKGDRQAHDAVVAALDTPIHDPVVKRQLEILRRSLTANQMEEADRTALVDLATAIEGSFVSFRPEVAGRRLSENEIEEILRSSQDEAERRRAWEASKQVGGRVGPRIRELARLRNKVARDLGFSDYYTMALDLQELPDEWMFGLLADLEEVTREPFDSYKASLDSALSARFGTTEIYPWHYADPFFQSVPPDGRVSVDPLLAGGSASELAARTFEAWGIDISHILDASDLYPRERKCQHAFCLDVDRSGKDIRILANVVPGERWVEVMLHECGHAAYDASIDPHLPWVLRRAAHTFVTEAIAILSGSLMRDRDWLIEIAGAAPGTVDDLVEELRQADIAQRLIFIRWGLVMCLFERDLYADPEADLDLRWWELVERFQGVAAPPSIPLDAWASKIHLAAAPAYYHNYLLGEVLAAQLRASVEQACDNRFVGAPAAGEFLMERVFRHGQLLRWDALIEGATGRPLSTKDLAQVLSH